MVEFKQDGPILSNQFTSDTLLQTYLESKIPNDYLYKVRDNLIEFGEKVIQEIYFWGKQAANQEPLLHQYDVWGNRIDHIEVSPGWIKLKNVAAEYGLVSSGYLREYQEFSRIIQFVKLFLFTPSSAIYTCPLAMTDGAARLIEIYGNEFLKENVLKHYISADINEFWVSGQWMTEKTGGSDLGRSETIAREENGEWRLYGPKWFTSAITAQTAMTLARIERNGETIRGSRGLSLFYLKIRDDDGKLNNIQINRLKDKLGTRALPTAELDLVGVPAILIGEEGRGIKQISTMLNITRIYNSISAIALMRRAYVIALDYAMKREAFERYLVDLPLHAETLVNAEIEYNGCFLLTFYIVELLGKSELDKATTDEIKILRILTPITKLWTGKKGIEVISELLECMGGAGYLEDSEFPTLLRDAQVLSIWEGTTNVLSLDVIRSIFREQTFDAFLAETREIIKNISKDFELEKSILELEILKLEDYYQLMKNRDSQLIESEARQFSFAIAKTMISILLVEFSDKLTNEKQKTKFVLMIQRWLDENKINLKLRDESYLKDTRLILDN